MARERITIYQFYQNLEKRQKEKPRERFGQAAYNLLWEMRGDIACLISEREDPFYSVKSNQDPGWRKFIAFVESHWYTT